MIGIDEVGRGAWAGPLLVCAARLHADIPGLTDSKLVTPKKREQLSEQILANADIGFGWVTAQEIDTIGLGPALRLASKRAIAGVVPEPNEEIVIDGSVNFLPLLNSKTVVKADLHIAAVSAASIVAKVARDAYMAKLDQDLPRYAFASHVGYGTAKHRAAIAAHGLCAEHRKSFKITI